MAEALPYIVDFDELRLEDFQRACDANAIFDGASTNDVEGCNADDTQPKGGKRESNFDAFMARVHSIKRSVNYTPFGEEVDTTSPDAIEPTVYASSNNHHSVRMNHLTTETADHDDNINHQHQDNPIQPILPPEEVISKREFSFRMNVLQNHQKWVEKAARKFVALVLLLYYPSA